MVKRDNDIVCPICIDELKQSELSVHLSCSVLHVLHFKCMESYLDYRQDCPICKKDIDVENIAIQKYGQGDAPGELKDEFLIKFRQH